MSQHAASRRGLPSKIPDDVDDPGVVKARGVVTLPRRVNWSEANPTYDLDDRRQRALVGSSASTARRRRRGITIAAAR